MVKVNYTTVMSNTYRCFNVIVHQWGTAPVKNKTLYFFDYVWDAFHLAKVNAEIFM